MAKNPQRIWSTLVTKGPREVARRVLWHALSAAGREFLQGAAHFFPDYVSREGHTLLQKNAALKGRHRGRRCFVIGNGPSLNTQDLAALEGEITVVMSAFWKHPIVERWQPSYYCFGDPLFFDGSEASNEFFRQLRSRIHASTFVVPLSTRDAIARYELLPLERIYCFAATGQPSPAPLNELDLTTPLRLRLVSVSQVAIGLAMYLGCSPIYLLGLDHDWLAHRGDHLNFYAGETIENHPEPVRTRRDPTAEELRAMLDLWTSYEVLLRYATKHGISIYNATNGGWLDVFERTSYESVTSARDSRNGSAQTGA